MTSKAVGVAIIWLIVRQGRLKYCWRSYATFQQRWQSVQASIIRWLL